MKRTIIATAVVMIVVLFIGSFLRTSWWILAT